MHNVDVKLKPFIHVDQLQRITAGDGAYPTRDNTGIQKVTNVCNQSKADGFKHWRVSIRRNLVFIRFVFI